MSKKEEMNEEDEGQKKPASKRDGEKRLEFFLKKVEQREAITRGFYPQFVKKD